jgi:hypothetical protein
MLARFLSGRSAQAAESDHDGTDLVLPTFSDRVRAWWNGDPPPRARRLEDGPEDPDSRTQSAAEPISVDGKERWTAERMKLAEQLWGESFCSPGGVEFILEMVKPLSLSPALTLLELGARLGGATRAIASTCGTWVTAYEADPDLAAAAMERSTMKGVEKKAAISPYDPETFKPGKRYDRIFAKEAFFCVRNKDALLHALFDGMKPLGQILFTDFVLADDNSKGRALDVWHNNEPTQPAPWSVGRYVWSLKDDLRLDLRVHEDITEKYMALIVAGWLPVVEAMKRKGADKAAMMPMLMEVELWARRYAALASGGLRVYRFFAIKPGEAPQ